MLMPGNELPLFDDGRAREMRRPFRLLLFPYPPSSQDSLDIGAMFSEKSSTR